MATLVSPTLTALLTDLEGLWQRFDELAASLGPEDWSRKHGKHWVCADVPYHLSYYDLDAVATPIQRGLSVPAEELQPRRTMAELDAWNATRFARRPANQTVEQSLAQMRASREAVRRAVAGLGDADLDQPVWLPLPRAGWITTRLALDSCYLHTWGHFMELRLRLKRDAPALSAAQMYRGLAFFMTQFSGIVDRQQAVKTRLVVVMDITSSGGGTWTFRIADGACRLSEDRASDADLVMTQRPESFVKTVTGIHNPMLAMVSGKIKVRGFRYMSTFGKLFHMPAPDQPLDFNLDPAEAANR